MTRLIYRLLSTTLLPLPRSNTVVFELNSHAPTSRPLHLLFCLHCSSLSSLHTHFLTFFRAWLKCLLFKQAWPIPITITIPHPRYFLSLLPTLFFTVHITIQLTMYFTFFFFRVYLEYKLHEAKDFFFVHYCIFYTKNSARPKSIVVGPISTF